MTNYRQGGWSSLLFAFSDIGGTFYAGPTEDNQTWFVGSVKNFEEFVGKLTTLGKVVATDREKKEIVLELM